MKIDKHEPGMFSWADLGTTDPEGAKKFYSELLGLEAMDLPMGEGMSYPESTEGRLWGQSLKKPEGAPLNLGEWF